MYQKLPEDLQIDILINWLPLKSSINLIISYTNRYQKYLQYLKNISSDNINFLEYCIKYSISINKLIIINEKMLYFINSTSYQAVYKNIKILNIQCPVHKRDILKNIIESLDFIEDISINISSLDEDEIELFKKYKLKTVNDLSLVINLKYSSVFLSSSLLSYTSACMNYTYNFKALINFLIAICPNLIKFHSLLTNPKIYKILIDNYPLLEEITINNCNLTNINICTLKKLTSLKINNCTFEDESLEFINNNKNFKKLKIINCSFIAGPLSIDIFCNNMGVDYNYPKLESLYLEGWISLEYLKNLDKYFKYLKSLEYLSINSDYFITNKVFIKKIFDIINFTKIFDICPILRNVIMEGEFIYENEKEECLGEFKIVKKCCRSTGRDRYIEISKK